MAVVVVRTRLGLDPGHVIPEDGPAFADIESGHQRLLELAAGEEVGDGNGVTGNELFTSVLEPNLLDLESNLEAFLHSLR